MRSNDVNRGRKALVWAAFTLVVVAPIIAATTSPLLAWRDPIYIIAGFADIVAMALLLVQPMLVAGYFPGLPPNRGRRLHRWIGVVLVLAVVLHIVGLWITSPPDVVDALLFASPTAFSICGVIAMWAVFASAVLAIMRRRLRLRVWRKIHTALAVTIVIGSVVHALLIDGTMEIVSKIVLSGVVLAVTLKVIAELQGWIVGPRKG